MPRPPKCRRVEFLPHLTFFKPAGVPLKELEEVSLTVEELEAIRLKDLEGLDQETCAARMGISRPTFHRLLSAGRAKLADALVEGKAIRIGGGNFTVSMRYFSCRKCKHTWEVPFGTGQRGIDMTCPSCSSPNIYRTHKGATMGAGTRKPPVGEMDEEDE